MDNLLVVEQLELHFGENYADTTLQATKFCATIIGKPWWRNRQTLLNNEGGLSGMRLTALMAIAEKEDIGVGLKAYGRYLRQEYGTTRTVLVSLNEESVAFHDLESKKIPLDDELEYGNPFKIETRDEPEALEASDSRATDALQSQYALHDVLKGLSSQENAVFSAYASTKDFPKSFILCGLTPEEGWRIYQRVHKRAARAAASCGGY